MFSATTGPRRLLAVTLLIVCASAAVGAETQDIHDSLVVAYLDANWDEAEQLLTSKSKEFAALTDPTQKADVVYVRQAIAECRPAWWKSCKAGKHAAFKALVWGRTLDVVYEPGTKFNTQMRVTNLSTTATITRLSR